MTGEHTVDNPQFFEDGGPAFEVRPAGTEVVGGVLFLHWFDYAATDHAMRHHEARMERRDFTLAELAAADWRRR